MITEEKPGSPGEVLEHFGTKGMKWGVRKSAGTRAFDKKFPTSGSRTEEIKRARKSVVKTEVKAELETDPKKKAALKELHLKNPDKATALRLTRGEKVAAGLLVTLVPTVVIPAAVAGTVAYRVGKRRRLES